MSTDTAAAELVVTLTEHEVSTLFMALHDRAEAMDVEAWRNDEEGDPESYWVAQAEEARALADVLHARVTAAPVGSRLPVSGP